MSEMVDRVATALAPILQDIVNGRRSNTYELAELVLARAAIATMREPTEEMLAARYRDGSPGRYFVGIWQAMNDAALR